MNYKNILLLLLLAPVICRAEETVKEKMEAIERQIKIYEEEYAFLDRALIAEIQQHFWDIFSSKRWALGDMTVDRWFKIKALQWKLRSLMKERLEEDLKNGTLQI